MLASWLWLLENEPEIAQIAHSLLLPKDYLRYRLTGEIGTEPSDTCGTLLFDTVHGEWSAQLLDALSLDARVLPPVHSSAEVAGQLRVDVAAQMGLPAGVPVIFGGGDQAMQALAHGVIEPELASCTIGSGGQLLVPVEAPTYDPHLRIHCFNHALPGHFFLEAATLTAGLSLRWLRDKVAPGTSYQELADRAAAVGSSNGLYFLPHLAGERTPYMDPNSKALFYGLTLDHDLGHMTRAVMEGVVFSLRAGLEIMRELDAPIERVVASGGGTRHPLWLQLLADIFNLPIHKTQAVEAAAVGAAMLAGVGVGAYADLAGAVDKVVRWSDEVIMPDPKVVVGYGKADEIFEKLYLAGKSICALGDRSRF
ncbi:MAG: xylulokinase, partial [Anaerolineales bacterium]|nr:xylulokinase [Anaerolineales bacterium]